MGLARRSGASRSLQRSATLRSSAGIGAVLCVAGFAASALQDRSAAVLETLEGEVTHAAPNNGAARVGLGDFDALAGDSFPQRGRRLQIDIDDPVIEKPYNEASNRGLIFLHCIGIMYMLLGLNTVCDIYFTGALEFMVDIWKIKPDVAGATFMAAGGSAPELFTALIGTCIAENDIGFGTIVGSAVFNVLFVIGLCGFLAKSDIKLTWWPLFRDCSYYIFGLSLLAWFASSRSIQLHEAIVLLLAYLVYCVMMFFNPVLETMFFDVEFQKAKRKVSCDVAPAQDCADTVTSVVPQAPDDRPANSNPPVAEAPDDRPANSNPPMVEYGRPQPPDDAAEEVIPTPSECRRSSETFGKCVVTANGQSTAICHKTKNVMLKSMSFTARHDERMASIGAEDPSASGSGVSSMCWSMSTRAEVGGSGDGNGDEAKAKEDGSQQEEDEGTLLDRPDGGLDLVIWCFSLPIYVPLYCLLPRPTEKTFLITFGLSLLWIAGFSFFLVWWVEILGEVIGIPTVIMGLTVLAAGTSIPDAISSIAVARAGEGDMAISSSIGSNIFDILVGLPIPWIIKIAFIEGGNYAVNINSEFLLFHVILLLGMVCLVILCIHMLKWRLNKMLGVCMAVLYVIFLVTAVLIEVRKPSSLKFRNSG